MDAVINIVGKGKQCLCANTGIGCAVDYCDKQGWRGEINLTGPCRKRFTDIPPLNDGHKEQPKPDAVQAILSDRGKTHGNFTDHARVACKLKDVVSEECRERNLRGQKPLSPEQREALEMIMHKVGRIIAGVADFNDHWDDIAGYARLCSK